MPPNKSAIYLRAELMPNSRQKVSTMDSALFYLKVAIICLSVNRDILM